MLKHRVVKMLPQNKPSPRLLNTVVPDSSWSAAKEGGGETRSALRGKSLFSGNGLAIFVGLLLGCFLLTGAGWFYNRAEHRAAAAPILIGAATVSVSASEHELVPLAPIMVQIAAEHIRVSAISLGHPRLAVINGQQLGEGEFLSVHAPTVRVEMKLQVKKIADGRIELSDGTQIITARLSLPDVRKAP